MQRIIITALLGVGLGALALSVPTSAAPSRAGKETRAARSSVQRTKPAATSSRSNARSNSNTRSNSNSRNSSRRGGNNVVAGNTVVVGGNPGGGYYNGGNYYGSPRYDDDDNDFLEFVGKTAAVTAGVAVVSAVIGDVVKDQPDDCEPINVGGQPYLNCNGVAYQQVQGGYQVVAPPQ
ncbi:MAG: hypothetical protein ACMVO5_10145 [Polymorphobacter sp.]|uniref:hypothetical protein n=1 Tax=Polymorphobacter sp. TaxID=1909290 RepID=UPI003A857BB3